MTPIVIGFLLAKATLLFAGGLVGYLTLKDRPAGLRQRICLFVLAASLLLPLILVDTHAAIPIRVDALAGTIAPGTHFGSATNLTTAIYAIWGTGAVLLLIRMVMGYWWLHRLVRAAREIGVRDGIPVLASAAPVPLVTGLLRPTILMPASAACSGDNYEAALRHECAHVERRDLWANLLAGFACVIWWFHPLAWMLAARQRTEQEAACDDAVIAAGFDPATYASALLAAAATPFRFSAHFLTTGSPMFTKNDLTGRIHRLAHYQPSRPLSRLMLCRLALGFATVLTVVALLGPAAAQEQPYKIGGDVTAPRVIDRVDPAYPQDARDASVTGTVVLRVIILASGTAGEITVERSPDPRLDDAAIAAVRQWTFAPGMRKGEPVPVQANIEVNFRLK